MIRCRAVKKDGNVVMGELRGTEFTSDELVVLIKPILDIASDIERVKLSECRKVTLSDVRFNNGGN
jgi:hypothetical protein